MRWLALTVVAGLLAGCGTTYRRPILGMGGGFSDRQIGEGQWRVVFGTNAYTRRGYALNAALYRAAELAHQSGYSHFQIVNSSLVVGTFSVGYGYAPAVGSLYGGEGVYLTVHGARTPDAPLACENSQGRGCITLPTEETLSQLGPIVRGGRGN